MFFLNFQRGEDVIQVSIEEGNHLAIRRAEKFLQQRPRACRCRCGANCCAFGGLWVDVACSQCSLRQCDNACVCRCVSVTMCFLGAAG